MFVVKDRRKVAEILYDEKDPRDKLLLARREAEFSGTTRVLLEPMHGSKLTSCRALSLYGNKLEALTHIETLATHAKELEEVNVRPFHGRGAAFVTLRSMRWTPPCLLV